MMECKEDIRPYLYGKLNQEVERQQYKGLTTDTVEVIVDNVENTISANVKQMTSREIDTLFDD